MTFIIIIIIIIIETAKFLWKFVSNFLQWNTSEVHVYGNPKPLLEVSFIINEYSLYVCRLHRNIHPLGTALQEQLYLSFMPSLTRIVLISYFTLDQLQYKNDKVNHKKVLNVYFNIYNLSYSYDRFSRER